MEFILRNSRINCFCKIKYHMNILAVHCNKSAKLNSNELGLAKYMAFSVYHLGLFSNYCRRYISSRLEQRKPEKLKSP